MIRTVGVVGGGPAGLRAAEVAARSGAHVTVFDAMPSVGRKFLVAGKGGLNLTHEEPHEAFAARYSGENQPRTIWPRLLEEFGPAQLRQWAADMGAETFIATSGRVYPRELKSARLLRTWVQRLRSAGVEFHMRQRLVWLGLTPAGKVRLEFAGGEGWFETDSAVLALGGGSWPQTGSDGSWGPVLQRLGMSLQPLAPANCGWEVAWPESGLGDAEGRPLKNVAAQVGSSRAVGELLITRYGLEGGVIYQLGRALRASPEPVLIIDFKPDVSAEQLARKLHGVLTDRWRLAAQRWKLSAAAQWILLHFTEVAACDSTMELARRVKNCPVPLLKARPLAEAISTAGGVAWPELDADLMVQRLPGVFAAGEMIDWEAPTGGYLLQGAFSTGSRAGSAAARWALGTRAPLPEPSALAPPEPHR